MAQGAPADLDGLQARIGHRFADRALLLRALTHSSYANSEPSAAELGDNEQMEFLGDAVLGFLVSEHLAQRFPGYREGRLSKLKHHLVSAVHLHGVALALEVGASLRVSEGEEKCGGRAKPGLLVDALEALIAAVYLDGGLAAARRFVCGTILSAAGEHFGEEAETLPGAVADYKGALQEWAQGRRLPQPRYTIVHESPGYPKTFTVEVQVGEEWSASADGPSKKRASQKAARAVYERILGGASPP